MKICLVANTIPSPLETWSGAEQLCYQTGIELIKNDHEVIFMVSSLKKPIQNVIKVPCPWKRAGYLAKLFIPFDIITFLYSLRILKRIRPDVVHFFAHLIFFPVLLACKILGIPTVLTVVDHWIFCPTYNMRYKNRECSKFHGHWCTACFPKIHQAMLKPFCTLRPRLFNFFLKQLTRIIALTETNRKRLLSYGFDEKRIRILYHYHPRIFSEKSFGCPTAIFVGSLRPFKGLHVVVAGIPSITKKIPDFGLIVVGDGDAEYVETLKEVGCRHLHFVGKKSNEETMKLIARSHLVVVPEQWSNEFGSLILVEALSSGKPVIASKIGAYYEFIKDGVNGYLVDHDSPEQFAQKIIQLLYHKNLLKSMSKKSKQSVNFLFDGSQTRRLIRLYEETGSLGRGKSYILRISRTVLFSISAFAKYNLWNQVSLEKSIINRLHQMNQCQRNED